MAVPTTDEFRDSLNKVVDYILESEDASYKLSVSTGDIEEDDPQKKHIWSHSFLLDHYMTFWNLRKENSDS